MNSVPSREVRSRRDTLLTIAGTALAVFALLLGIATASAKREHAAHGESAATVNHEAMSEEEMARWVDDWFALNPPRGLGIAAGPPVATFIASGITFNADGNAGTPIDTVRIFTGETVRWQRNDGSHTVTSGTSISDPAAGELFDAPLQVSPNSFEFTFTAPGLYPFFCRPHGSLGMRGYVLVTDPEIGATIEIRDFEFVRVGGPTSSVEIVPILQNQAVRWIRVEGFHTVTNGTGDADPQAGNLFDAPIDEENTEFVQVFRDLGDVPFFCRPHELLEMRGLIRVLPAEVVGVRDGAARIGFTGDPAPNPTRAGFQFRFRIAREGRVHARILDVRGARVADVVDRSFEPGEYVATWDGRTVTREAATAGVYFLQLTAPDLTSTRRFVVAP